MVISKLEYLLLKYPWQMFLLMQSMFIFFYLLRMQDSKYDISTVECSYISVHLTGQWHWQQIASHLSNTLSSQVSDERTGIL